ncbi:MAG: hypothetical protein WBG18_06035, partial [Xanthobacteraceae bacterium]
VVQPAGASRRSRGVRLIVMAGLVPARLVLGRGPDIAMRKMITTLNSMLRDNVAWQPKSA